MADKLYNYMKEASIDPDIEEIKKHKSKETCNYVDADGFTPLAYYIKIFSKVLIAKLGT